MAQKEVVLSDLVRRLTSWEKNLNSLRKELKARREIWDVALEDVEELEKMAADAREERQRKKQAMRDERQRRKSLALEAKSREKKESELKQPEKEIPKEPKEPKHEKSEKSSTDDK